MLVTIKQVASALDEAVPKDYKYISLVDEAEGQWNNEVKYIIKEGWGCYAQGETDYEKIIIYHKNVKENYKNIIYKSIYLCYILFISFEECLNNQ